MNELEQLEAEMKKLNVDFVYESEIPKTRHLCVEVDIDCDVVLPDAFKHDALLMRKKVMRGSQYYVAFLDENPGTLTLKIGVELPKDFIEVYKSADFDMLTVLATTFPDLCWIHAEGTTPQTLTEVSTVVREGVLMGDLTWVLPSKFVDDFVEMMHTLNQGIIGGLMQDAIIYGPFILGEEETLK